MFERLFTLVLCVFNAQPNPTCILNTRIDFREPLPVILRNGHLLEPNDPQGNIILQKGEELTLSCEGSSIEHPNVISGTTRTTASIFCKGGDNFRNDEWLTPPVRFNYFRCILPPNYQSQRTNRTCFDSNSIIEVGYKIQNQFYPAYESCFNEGIMNVLYSKYTQKPYNANYQTRVERPFFISNDIFGFVPIETLFSPRGQKAAVAQLVGPMIEDYFTKTQLLSRGHLAAKTDYVFAFGQRATFHYVNCAPQWTGFNGGNWNTLEVDLRNHIRSEQFDTIVYTGTFGVTQLLDQLGHRVNIYLYTDTNNNPIIPVPQYYYKVVYEPSTMKGIAFVGINNPYYNASEAKELFFCNDVCRRNSNFYWLTWHPDNPAEGYTFCCTIHDFRNTVKHLPPFEVSGLLFES